MNQVLCEQEKGKEQKRQRERGSENALSVFCLLCVAHLSAMQLGSLTEPCWLIHITKPRRSESANMAKAEYIRCYPFLSEWETTCTEP